MHSYQDICLSGASNVCLYAAAGLTRTLFGPEHGSTTTLVCYSKVIKSYHSIIV